MSLLIEVLLFTLLGCCSGIVTGLIPGIHINTVAVMVISIMPLLAGFSGIAVATWLMAMAVTHTFLDFIPSILLGAPESDSALSVLPGHKMLLQGRAIEAIKLTALGSLCSLLVVGVVFLFVIRAVPVIYEILKPILYLILLFIVFLGFSFEKYPLKASFVFILGGFFGLFVLGTNLFSDGIIFPALSGLFGTSTLLLSLKEDVHLPPQINAKVTLNFKRVMKNSLLGSFSGMLVGLLPGVGSAQATFITQRLTKKASVTDFLVAVSGVNTANIIFTLVVLYAIGKMRSGIVIAINTIISVISFQTLLIFLGVIILAGGIAMFLHLKIGVFVAKWLGKRDVKSYKKVTVGVIILICASVFLLTGVPGLLVLALGTVIGLIPPLSGVRRSECMGFFIFPVILFYTGLNLVLFSFLGI